MPKLVEGISIYHHLEGRGKVRVSSHGFGKADTGGWEQRSFSLALWSWKGPGEPQSRESWSPQVRGQARVKSQLTDGRTEGTENLVRVAVGRGSSRSPGFGTK